MAEYDAFQQAITQHMGRPLTQQELDNNEFLYQLPNDLIALLPAGRLQTFSAERLMALDNADLFALIMHNPNVANQMPGYRFTGGGGYGGFSSDQLQQVIGRAGSMGIQGPGIQGFQTAVSRVTGAPAPGAAPGTTTPGTTPPASTAPGASADQTPWETLAREQWQAQLAQEPGDVYTWLARSRGMEPVGGARQIYLPGAAPQASAAPSSGGYTPGANPAADAAAGAPMTGGVGGMIPGGGGPINMPGGESSTWYSTQGASAPPGYGQPGNPWTSAGSQIVNQQRPTFDQLRGQVQAQGADIPIGVLNTVQNRDLPSYTTQGGMPLLSAQSKARMSPAERALWDVTVNRTGGRAEDDRYQASRLGRTGGAATVAYTGASRTPGTRRY